MAGRTDGVLTRGSSARTGTPLRVTKRAIERMEKRVDFICDCGRNYERDEEKRDQRKGCCGAGGGKKKNGELKEVGIG
jgi:hypothetical protein